MLYTVPPEGFRAGPMTMQVAVDFLTYPDMPMVLVNGDMFPLERIPSSENVQSVGQASPQSDQPTTVLGDCAGCDTCYESARRPRPSSDDAGAAGDKKQKTSV